MTQTEWQQLEETVHRLSPAEKARLKALLDQSLDSQRKTEDPLLGLMADEPELVDSVLESAMLARERDPLRISDNAEDTA